ncbi:hypothetical protein Cfor_07108, partial [Coptotermes formosanus]
LGISDRRVWYTLHEDLHLHPYKIQMVQGLLPLDLIQEVQFCSKLLLVIDTNSEILHHLIMSDKAHFHFMDTPINRTSDTGQKKIHTY